MVVLYTVLTVLLFLLSILAHEAAHAAALYRNGFIIKEMGLGLSLPPRLLMAPKRLPFRLSLSPWLVGAYVTPRKEDLEAIDELPYREHAWISGAGIVANLIIGGFFAAAFYVARGEYFMAGLVAAATLAVWPIRKLMVAYVFPAISIPLLLWVLYVIADGFGEPAGVMKWGDVLSSSQTLQDVLILAAALNLAMAALNVIPIYPLDGGRVIERVAQRYVNPKVVQKFRASGTIAIMFLTCYVLLSDLFYL